MPDTAGKSQKTVHIFTRPRESSESSSTEESLKMAAPLQSPRAARFAEATAVHSPIEPGQGPRSPFAESLTTHYMAEAQPADVGFGYLRSKHDSVEMPKTPRNGEYPITPKTPLKSPLKSAMKTPGAPPRDVSMAIKTPAFHEEYLEKREKHAEKRQRKDLRIKTNVRLAKVLMRSVNFSCSLILLAMLSSSLTIFQATKDLPARGSFHAWAPQQKIWPQVTILSIASASLLASAVVIYAYIRGRHKRVKKANNYYQFFSLAFFTMSIILWGIGAAILQNSHKNSNGKDMWSWSCAQNTRSQLYSNTVPYALICRLQNWSLICIIIEVVVETVTIVVYSIIFYRFYSKRALRKSMAHRDRARSDLYLSQLKSQSAPGTPGINGPMSAREAGWQPIVEYYEGAPDIEDGNANAETQYVSADQKHTPAPFILQPPPAKLATGATPKMEQVGFTPIQSNSSMTTTTGGAMPLPRLSTALSEHQWPPTSPFVPEGDVARETQQEHFAAAPGEPVYDFVPLPGAYEAPLSPGPEEQHFGLAR